MAASSLLTFQQIASADVPTTRVGGKGKALSDLSALPLPSIASIPTGGVVPTDIYRAHVRPVVREAVSNHGAAAVDAAFFEELRVLVGSIPLADAVRSDIAALMSSISDAMRVPASDLRFAVRSSGASEDGVSASFAGQYASILNVRGHAGVCDAVAQVWASQFNEHIISYLTHHAGGSHDAAAGADAIVIAGVAVPDMAVVVQVQIPSQVAGVLFTVDPNGAGRRTAVIEAVYGQGEGLVSGEITPEHMLVDWSDLTAIHAVNHTRATQLQQYACLPDGGIALVDTTLEQRAAPLLTAALVDALVRTGLTIAAARGRPQDVEWAWYDGKLYVVQTRPVTRYTYARDLGRWQLILANKSCVFDESLIGDGFRRFILNRYAPPQPSWGVFEVTFTTAVSDGTEGHVPVLETYRAAALRVQAGPMADVESMHPRALHMCGDQVQFIFATGHHAEAAIASFAGDAATVVALVRATSLEQFHACAAAAVQRGFRAVVIIASVAMDSNTLASTWKLPAAVHVGPHAHVFLILDAKPLHTMLPPSGAAAHVASLPRVNVCITDRHLAVVEGRTFANCSMTAVARAGHYRVANPAALVADITASTEHFRAVQVPVIEGFVSRLVARTLHMTGAAPSLFTPEEVTPELIMEYMQGYREGGYATWSAGYHVDVVQQDFEAEVARVKADIDAAGADVGNLLTGITSRNALDELEAMALRHAGNPFLRRLVDDPSLDTPAFVRAVTAATDDPHALDFKAQFAHYLTHYGWMADLDEDLATEHWAENPAFPLTIVRNIMRGAPSANAAVAEISLPPAAPTLLARASSTAPADKYEVTCVLLSDAVPADSPFWSLLQDVRTCLRLKERVHTQYVRVGFILKLLLLHWMKQHSTVYPDLFAAMPHADAWFYAPFPLWVRAVRTPTLETVSALQKEAHTRYLEARMWRNVDTPSRISPASRVDGGDGDSSAMDAAAAAAAETLTGMACSAGLAGPVQGVACVVLTLDAAHTVKKGDILITKITSPAWTPLFSLVSAVVLEEGGMLSHGAVVARECGIPAVTRVADATRIIRSGTTLIVDGQAGAVHIVRG